MGIVVRIILTLYTFCLAIISFLMVLYGLAPDQIPLVRWMEEARTGAPRVALLIAGLAFFAASLYLIVIAFTRQRGGQAVVHDTDLGEVRISLDAVENLVRRVARSVKGVRDIRADVVQAPAGLVVDLRGVISPEVSVPEVSAEIQQAVRQYVRRVVGVDVAEVRIRVENIANEARRRLD